MGWTSPPPRRWGVVRLKKSSVSWWSRTRPKKIGDREGGNITALFNIQNERRLLKTSIENGPRRTSRNLIPTFRILKFLVGRLCKVFLKKKGSDSLKRATFCSSRSKRADEKKAMQKVKWGKVLKRPHRQFDVSGLLSNFIKYKNIEKKIVKRNDWTSNSLVADSWVLRHRGHQTSRRGVGTIARPMDDGRLALRYLVTEPLIAGRGVGDSFKTGHNRK